MPRRQRLWLGAASGLFLSLPLAAICYAGYRRAGLPFIPFNLFDWATRHLPGAVLAAAIGSMVHVIGWLNLGRTSVTAKQMEQTLAVAGFVAAGTFAGAAFFGIAHLFRRSGGARRSG